MVGWQITAATLRCDVIDEEVTLLVYRDWTVKCTEYSPSEGIARGPHANCPGTDCQLAADYIRKLKLEEEAGA